MPKQLPATSLATMSRSPPPHAPRSPVSLPRALSSFKIPLVGLRLSHPPSVCLSLGQSACLFLCLLPLRSPLLVSRIAFSFTVPSPGAVLTSILSRASSGGKSLSARTATRSTAPPHTVQFWGIRKNFACLRVRAEAREVMIRYMHVHVQALLQNARGDFGPAEEMYQAALAVDASDAVTLYNYGLLLENAR